MIILVVLTVLLETVLEENIARKFQGHINGVAKRFQDDNAAAISVHCLAHCVNLCLQVIAVSSQLLLAFQLQLSS